MTYPGGKSQAGAYQTIINQQPPHRVYIEPFLGGGGVLLKKRPATQSIGVEKDRAVFRYWQPRKAQIPGLTVLHGDAFTFLQNRLWAGDELVYADPPYLLSTRRSQRPLYREELTTEAEHLHLLSILKALPCPVQLSGYWSDLYANELAGWRAISYQAITRSGAVATEWLWMNYPEPARLHDYRYLGANFRQRERIKRQQTRWRARLAKMPRLQRLALLSVIQSEFFGEPGDPATPGEGAAPAPTAPGGLIAQNSEWIQPPFLAMPAAAPSPNAPITAAPNTSPGHPHP